MDRSPTSGLRSRLSCSLFFRLWRLAGPSPAAACRALPAKITVQNFVLLKRPPEEDRMGSQLSELFSRQGLWWPCRESPSFQALSEAKDEADCSDCDKQS